MNWCTSELGTHKILEGCLESKSTAVFTTDILYP